MPSSSREGVTSYGSQLVSGSGEEQHHGTIIIWSGSGSTNQAAQVMGSSGIASKIRGNLHGFFHPYDADDARPLCCSS